MKKPPHIKTTFPELRASHPEAWAYIHIIHKPTGYLLTFGLDLDTFEWNGQTDDVLEDDTNAAIPPIEPTRARYMEYLADTALYNFKGHALETDFEDYGGQAFSENLLAYLENYEATLSFEYEEA